MNATRWVAASGLAIVLLIGATGCDQTLETGYKPRPLTANAASRRAYYASPFTPEAAAGEQQGASSGTDTLRGRRPGN